MTTVDTAPGPAPAPPGPAARPATGRLTPIEELDYLLDRPAEPNLVLWEIHSHGHLDRTALAEAVTAAFAADSGARRRLTAASPWARRLYWRSAASEPGQAQLTVSHWRTQAELDALRERLFAWPIPLAEAVVRVVLAVGPDHDALIMQVHHTAFDGISSLRLLTTVTGSYRRARATAAHLHSVPSPPAPLADKNSLASPTTSTSPARATMPLPAGRARAAGWPGTVTRIAPQSGQPGRPGYGFVLISGPVPRPARRGYGTQPTVNDLLVTALCLTIDRWNTSRGRASGQISVTIPVNGRAAGQRWQGDGNLSWLIRVTTSPAQRADPARLLADVAAQSRAARQRGSRGGTDAMSRLLATSWAPVAVKRRVARLVRTLAAPVLTDTTLVSNLGLLPDPPTFDGSGTEPLWLAPPGPMPRGLSVGAVSVAGRLYLSVRYRLTLLDRAAAEDFTGRLRATLGELAPPGPGDPREAPP